MAKRKSREPEDDRDEGHLVPIMNVMLLMIPALLLAMEIGPMSAVYVSPPKFSPEPGAEAPTREPLLLRVAILEDGFRVETQGARLGESNRPTIPLSDPALAGAERYDYDALETLARRLKAAHPEDTAVTLGAEGSIDFQTVVTTLDALRGRECRLAEPRECLFWHPVIEAGTV